MSLSDDLLTFISSRSLAALAVLPSLEILPGGYMAHRAIVPPLGRRPFPFVFVKLVYARRGLPDNGLSLSASPQADRNGEEQRVRAAVQGVPVLPVVWWAPLDHFV